MVVAEYREPDFGIMLWRTTKVAWRGDFGKTGGQSARPFCRFFPVFSQGFGGIGAAYPGCLGSAQILEGKLQTEFEAVGRFALNLEAAV